MPGRKRNQDIEKRHLVIDESGDDELEEKLPIWRKLCFALGGAPYQTTNTVINFFISIFLLEVAEIPPYYVSVILFGGKVWDALTDPACGYLVNRTETRFGKYRPWILFSAPFACGAYYCLWYVPDFTDEGKLGWYFIFYCLFQCFLTGLHVPYTSLTMSISSSQKQRDSATVYRMVSEAVGVLVAVVIQGQLVNKARDTECEVEGTTISPNSLNDEKWAYSLGAIIVIGAYMVCSFTVFFGVKEVQIVTEEDNRFFKGLYEVMSFKPYVILSVAFLFLSLAIAIVQGNLALFCTHSLDLGDYFSSFILTLLVSSILSMPVWQMCLLRFGKKSTFAAGMIIFVPVLISQLYVTDNVYVYFPILVLAGFSISVALLLPWSMLPDVIDQFYLEKGTRKDAIFYSFYVFFNKLAVGVGLGISQAFLAVGGYETGVCKQPKSVGLTLRMLVVPGPVLFVLIALVALWYYPINEKRRIRNKNELARREKERKHRKRRSCDIEDQLGGISASYESISSTLTGSTSTSQM